MSLTRLRSLLFLPATAERHFAKAVRRGADALILDLEDSVASNRKDEARRLAAAAARTLSDEGATVIVRVNAARDLLELDMASIPMQVIAAIMLPKVEDGEDVQYAESLWRKRAPADLCGVRFIPTIETPKALLSVEKIAQSSNHLAAIAFGSEDFSAAMGIEPTTEALRFPAQQVVIAASAYGLPAIGLAGSVAGFSDAAAYTELVRTSRALGFSGSVALHPDQIATLNTGFSPSADQLAWARRVVQAQRRAAEAGEAVTTVDGRMIDAPVVARALRYLDGVSVS
ncbi:CoA ester lyase [Paraburkholderia agricolaris]|uniref:HpcH/HpaI aldolase/citrate lyase family protein n=1 Tax=Paraburkholderia agricolaris TaxID=2152888 RepID=UPI001291FFCE|nr:CoA ester lyase [Paraburkholderia agricolaris]